MKGEIFRRMSMEIIKDEGVELPNPINNHNKEDDDYLEKTIGAFGLWQAVVAATVALTRAIAVWNVMSLPFLTPNVDFVCVEFSDNVTIAVKNSTCYDNCLKYNYSSFVGRSIIEDFGLICHDAWLASFAQTVLMLGYLIGVSLFGWISDRFGRRAALIPSTFLNAVFMVALSFSPNYIIFTSIRFAIGIATGGVLFTSVVHVMEIIGKRHREVAAVCCLIPEGLAQASLAGFAYFTSNWQNYTLSYGVATCLIFVLILFVPESPRWLVSNGKVDEAIDAITIAANRNNLNTSHIKEDITKAIEDLNLKDRKIIKTSYIDFFKSKAVFFVTSFVFIIWLTLGISFYGIYQYVTFVSSNPYLTLVMSGFIQIPFYPLAIVLNQRFGRKMSSIGTAAVVAIAMLILIIVPKGHWLGTILGVIAFIFSNICFSVSYAFVSELYPTPLRNMSFGLASSGAKIGALVAPFIASLSPQWLPSLIFGVFPIISGLCFLALPETKGQNLKDTIDE